MRGLDAGHEGLDPTTTVSDGFVCFRTLSGPIPKIAGEFQKFVAYGQRIVANLGVDAVRLGSVQREAESLTRLWVIRLDCK